MVVRVDPDPSDELPGPLRAGECVVELDGLAGKHAGVEDLDAAREIHLAADRGLDAGVRQLGACGIGLEHLQEHPWRYIGRERVPHVAVLQHEGRLQPIPRESGREERNLNPPPHHVGVVDAAPEVRAVRHVAVLTVSARSGLGTLLPLAVRVLERLSVHARVIEELVTLGAEAAFQILGPHLEAAVRKRIGLRTGVRAPGGTEGAALPDVAAGADQTLSAQVSLELGVGAERRAEGLLLSQGSVTALTVSHL